SCALVYWALATPQIIRVLEENIPDIGGTTRRGKGDEVEAVVDVNASDEVILHELTHVALNQIRNARVKEEVQVSSITNIFLWENERADLRAKYGGRNIVPMITPLPKPVSIPRNLPSCLLERWK